MIWFKSQLNIHHGEKYALDQSVGLTKAVKSILKTDTVQITGFQEIGENIEEDYIVDEELWEAFANWETTLEQTATKLKTLMVDNGYELTVFLLKNGQKIIKISNYTGPVWYVRAA
tara:strand:+ start:1175 stop:1522 length:348 start_codon:yes stop_codon:yes gene_type:complete